MIALRSRSRFSSGLTAARLALVLGGGLGLAACGFTAHQKDAVAEFSRASSAFGATVSSQMVEMRTTVIELNTQVLALDPARIRDRDNLDAAFSNESVGARVRAARVIQTYGELLSALVDDRQEQNLQAAAGSFTQSVRGLDPGKARLSDEDLQAVGRAVAAIGGLLVDKKKADALGEIIPRAHPQVAEIGRLFKSEFDPKDGALARNFEATGERAVRATDGVLDAKASPLVDRVYAATVYQHGIETARRANTLFPSLSESSSQMVQAHARLVESLARDRPSVDDIKAFAKTVQTLVTSVKILADR